MNFYNEIDRHAAAWLRNLIAAGHIAPGVVDERSIVDLRPGDLAGFTQCHFFAGIGGWSLALRLAGWPDDRPVWTGSCPCQPFSAAGQQRGSEDERHLWPAFFDLIRECRPASVFGEQVAGAAGLAWLDHVCADLEGAGYAAAAANLCAAGAGAFHIRQRLYWVANADGGNATQERTRHDAQHEERAADGRRTIFIAGPGTGSGTGARVCGTGRSSVWSAGEMAADAGGVADAECRAAERRGFDLAGTPRGDEGQARQRQRVRHEPGAGSDAGLLGNAGNAGNAGNEGLEVERRFPGVPCGASGAGAADALAANGLGNANSSRSPEQRRGWDESARLAAAGVLDPWADIEWIACSDGKARPTQPGLFPLAHGIPGRVGRLRAYGNAIVPQVAAAFIRSVMQ